MNTKLEKNTKHYRHQDGMMWPLYSEYFVVIILNLAVHFLLGRHSNDDILVVLKRILLMLLLNEHFLAKIQLIGRQDLEQDALH